MGISRRHGHGTQDPRRDVGDRRPHLDQGTAAAFAGDAHQAAHALGNQVEAAPLGIRAGTPETRNGAINKPRIFLAKHVIPQAQLIHGVDPVIFNHRIGGLQKPFQHFLAGVVLQVDGDAAFVAVHHHEGRRLAVDVGGQEVPGIVAAGDLFHLDHVGAHVGQHQATGRPRHDVRQFEDLEAGKRPAASRHVSGP